MRYARDMSFGRDMRYARLRLQEEIYSPTASDMRYTRDMHFVRDMSFGRDMRYARLKLQGRIEYHCDCREQYHFCKAKISRRAKQGITLKYLPPDSTPQRCNALYLAGQGV